VRHHGPETGELRNPDGADRPFARHRLARDPASGLPTGKRQHKPLFITKQIDKATPLLIAPVA
jgi:type VI protein secretion system component Hcp